MNYCFPPSAHINDKSRVKEREREREPSRREDVESNLGPSREGIAALRFVERCRKTAAD